MVLEAMSSTPLILLLFGMVGILLLSVGTGILAL